jgi:hypothetical protein
MAGNEENAEKKRARGDFWIFGANFWCQVNSFGQFLLPLPFAKDALDFLIQYLYILF